MFLQKASDAKRVYANLLYTKTNNDGAKSEGMFFPSKHAQKKLLTEFYKEIGICPTEVNFVEAHATGTVAGDPEEAWAIDEVFCSKRKSSLPIGSIKSNMGHAESASTVASIAKILLTFESKQIPPNINFETVRPEISGLVEGRMRVVTEVEKLDGPLIAMNSFGIIGANVHALLKGNMKEKLNMGIPNDGLPRLVLWSGRTREAVVHIFDEIEKHPLDAEFIALLQSTQVKTSPTHIFHGYGVFKHDHEKGCSVNVLSDTKHSELGKRPIVWIFSGVGSQWTGMGQTLMTIPVFLRAFEKCCDVLKEKEIDLKHIMSTTDEAVLNDVTNIFLGIIAIQIGLTDVLNAIGIIPDYIVGHSVGELGCAYADGTLSLEETILCAYERGSACKKTFVVEGGMAAVAMELEDLKNILPNDIDIACHNNKNLFTVSGPIKSITNFVELLESKNIFAKYIASTMPFHSRYIANAGPLLFEKLKEIIKNPKQRSGKWLSTSVSATQNITEESQLSSAQYHTRNLLNPVLFAEACETLPSNSLTIEIAPHGLLKAVLIRSMKQAVHVSLTKKSHSNEFLFLTEALGK